MTNTTTSYDAIPYESRAFAQSQPEQLAVMATMFGLTPKAPSRARVLELGCSAGGNLIPLAARYPNAAFLGIDYSEVQANAGRQTILDLGLPNILIEQYDITRFAKRERPFDYIICHGVYSWVTPEVQTAILRVCAENLAPDGVAYISYNTYPGWKAREIVRDVMMFHTRGLAEPKKKIEQARAMLKFTEEISDANTAFGKMLREEAAIVAKAPDYYLFHEHLEKDNRPCYFGDFIERAQQHDLGFLGEAVLADMAPQRLGEKAHNTLQTISGGNILATEQYMDFLRNRSFRQTLLVRSEVMSRIKRAISPDTFKQFLLTCQFRPTRPCVPETGEQVEFRHPNGRSIKTVVPLIKAMLLSLNEAFPRPTTYTDWVAATRAKLEGKIVLTEADMRSLDDHLLRFVLDNAMQLHIEPETIGNVGGVRRERPCAFGPARLTARRQQPVVPNWRHESVALNQLESKVLGMLDGNASKEALSEALVLSALNKEFTLSKDNVVLTDVEQIRPIVGKILADALTKFEQLALLV